MATLYKYGGAWISSACSNCGKIHQMFGVGLDGSQNPPTPVHVCQYNGPAVVVADTFAPTTDATSIAAVVAAIISGAIVRD